MPESCRGAAGAARDAPAVRGLRARCDPGWFSPRRRLHCSICRSPRPVKPCDCCVDCRIKEQPSLVAPVPREVLGRSGVRATPPSHVLFEGRAIPLASEPARRRVAHPEPLRAVISLPDGLAGVSRRHCTFVRDGEELRARRSQSLRHFREWRTRRGARAHSCRRQGSRRRARHRAGAHHDRCVKWHAVAAASRSSACRSSTASAAALARSSCSTRSSAPRAASQRTRNNDDLTAQVNKVEEEVLVGTRNLVVLRNTLEKTETEKDSAASRSHQARQRSEDEAARDVRLRCDQRRAARAHREAEGRHHVRWKPARAGSKAARRTRVRRGRTSRPSARRAAIAATSPASRCAASAC